MKYEVFHDCYYDILNKSLTTKKFHYLESVLPAKINSIGEQWGWNDTVFKDKLFLWISDNKDKLE